MKIKAAHLEHIKTSIAQVLETFPNSVDRYESGSFFNSDKVKDLQRRFCFDLANAAGLTKFFCDEIYSYANDDHIYTALKAVCPKVTRKY